MMGTLFKKKYRVQIEVEVVVNELPSQDKADVQIPGALEIQRQLQQAVLDTEEAREAYLRNEALVEAGYYDEDALPALAWGEDREDVDLLAPALAKLPEKARAYLTEQCQGLMYGAEDFHDSIRAQVLSASIIELGGDGSEVTDV